MRYLILSDMHSNIEALRAVLRHVRRKRFDGYLVLGDFVGYGASPNEVIDEIRKLRRGSRSKKLWKIRGNHDKVVAGMENGENFNHAALTAAQWTTGQLRAANLRYLRQLERGPVDLPDGFAICHGSPLDEDQYVLSIFDAWEIFSHTEVELVFFGHTHVPSLFIARGSETKVALLRGPSGSLRLEAGTRYLINPGSVGQPRDRDPRASYMTYDSQRRIVRWYRIDYPIEAAQQRILDAGLPRLLAERLALGV